MKLKIIGVSVCILLISTIAIPVASITDIHRSRATSYIVEVPIWEKGDEWTYIFTESSKDYPATYSISGNLKFKVMDDSGDSYILKATTRPRGAFDLGDFGLKTTLFTSLTMRLQIRKADFGLESCNYKLKGILLVTIGPFTLPIPLQIVAHYNVEFDPTWVIMPFPLFDGKFGNLSGTEFVHTNFFLHMFWGLIPFYGPEDISWPITSVPYICSEDQITVEANTFDVYNVSAEWMEGSRFVSYYSEEVGNVAKEIIYIPYHGGGGVRYSLTLELKDWSYTP